MTRSSERDGRDGRIVSWDEAERLVSERAAPELTDAEADALAAKGRLEIVYAPEVPEPQTESERWAAEEQARLERPEIRRLLNEAHAYHYGPGAPPAGAGELPGSADELAAYLERYADRAQREEERWFSEEVGSYCVRRVAELQGPEHEIATERRSGDHLRGELLRQADRLRAAAWDTDEGSAIAAEIDALAALDTPDGEAARSVIQGAWDALEREIAAGRAWRRDLPSPERRTFAELRPVLWKNPALAVSVYRVLLVLAWPRALREWRRDHAAEIAAAHRAPADDPAARKALAAELRKWIPDALAEAESAGPGAADGIAVADERVAAWLERLGKPGSPLRTEAEAAAAAWRTKARAHWASAVGQGTIRGVSPDVPEPFALRSPVSFAQYVATALWHGQVEAEYRKGGLGVPALPELFAMDLQTTVFAATNRRRRVPEAVEIVSPGDEILATVPALEGRTIEEIERAVSEVGRLMGHRIIRGLANEVHRRWVAGVDHPVLTWSGMPGFLEWLGVNSNKADALAMDVLRAGQQIRKRWAGGEVGGLWTYAYQRPAPGRPAFLEVRPGIMFEPQYAQRLGLSSDKRWLRPVLPLPPFVGRVNDHAAQASFQDRLTGAMLDRRRELLPREEGGHGGAQIEEGTLRSMAESAGLPHKTMRDALERWAAPADGFLDPEAHSRGLFHLAQRAPFDRARTFLENAGRSTNRGRDAGRKAAANKRAARKGRGPR